MKKINCLNIKDMEYFYQVTKVIKKIKQDTIFNQGNKVLQNKYSYKWKIQIQESHSNFFKKDYSSEFVFKKSFSYIRGECIKKKLCKLKNKLYFPKILLDVHGLNQEQAKKKIGKLIFMCYKEKIFCFAIIHGHGKNILKNKIPIWLSQHPNIIAFYQVPKFCGKNVALFVLIENQ